MRRELGRPLETATRLEYFDGLRGILCLAVVYHHFLCGFDPCLIFGESPVWVSDPTFCQGQSPVVFLQPLINGRFAVTAFFVISGTVLAHSLLSAEESKWRLAVVKRYFRIALPCAAAMLFSYFLGDSTVHQEVAVHTKSMWLEKDYIRRPPTLMGLVLQLVTGISHGHATLNNGLWNVHRELMGSFFVFLVVALLRGAPPRVRRRLLLAVFGYLLLPSTTVTSSVKVRVAWQHTPSHNDNTTTWVSMNPTQHFHIFQQINHPPLRQWDMVAQPLRPWNPRTKPQTSGLVNEGNVTSAIAIGEMWEELVDQLKDLATLQYDINTAWAPQGAETHSTLGDLQTRTTGGTLREMLQGSIFTQQEMIRSEGWTSFNPYIWYAPFVVGVWIADQHLQHPLPSPKHSAHWPIFLMIVGYALASFPFEFGTEMHRSNRLWGVLDFVAKSSGLGMVKDVFWYILGAACLVQGIVLSQVVRRILTIPPLLWLGKISFSLYLIHFPLLLTVTGRLFLMLLGLGWSSYAAGRLALLGSFPVMLGVAEVFFRCVDRPAIRWSQTIGRKILGIDSK